MIDVFFPCLLLIFCIFLGCAFYRVIRDGAFCSIVCGSSEHSFGRNGHGGTTTSSSHRTMEARNSTHTHELPDAGVETSLRQNIASAIIAGREARRLANILATSRGISTEECLERVRVSAQQSSGVLMFEFDEEDDLPPSYEDCVSPSTDTTEAPKSDGTETAVAMPSTSADKLP